jgi:hypothetical protein
MLVNITQMLLQQKILQIKNIIIARGVGMVVKVGAHFASTEDR